MVRLCQLCRLSLGLLNFAAAPAHADEAFLCGPDTVVYVAVGELEMKKRTDPCVASHFGLTVEASPAKADPGPAVAYQPPKPDKAASTKSTRAAKGAPLPLKALKAPEEADPVSAREERSAALAVRAMPGTDYRNIRVLNASSPGGAWYRHTR